MVLTLTALIELVLYSHTYTATTYADARDRSRRRPRGGGHRGRPLACRTRQQALQTHHPPARPVDTDYERDEEHYTNMHAGSRTEVVPTTHPLLVPQPRSRVAGVFDG